MKSTRRLVYACGDMKKTLGLGDQSIIAIADAESWMMHRNWQQGLFCSTGLLLPLLAPGSIQEGAGHRTWTIL